jgi:hypothetical protein
MWGMVPEASHEYHLWNILYQTVTALIPSNAIAAFNTFICGVCNLRWQRSLPEDTGGPVLLVSKIMKRKFKVTNYDTTPHPLPSHGQMHLLFVGGDVPERIAVRLNEKKIYRSNILGCGHSVTLGTG